MSSWEEAGTAFTYSTILTRYVDLFPFDLLVFFSALFGFFSLYYLCIIVGSSSLELSVLHGPGCLFISPD